MKFFRYSRFSKIFLSMVAISLMVEADKSSAYEMTSFSTTLGDSATSGTISIVSTHIYQNPLDLTPGPENYQVAYQYFTPTVSGEYAMGQMEASLDTALLLYGTDFSPIDPTMNFIASNDDIDVNSISDTGLRAYVSGVAFTGSGCGGGNPYVCPMISYNLTAGTKYYMVITPLASYMVWPTANETITFYVMGSNFVLVGPQPVSTNVHPLAAYLGGSTSFSGVTSYLDNLSTKDTLQALSSIFPTHTSVSNEITRNALSHSSDILMSKIGTVLGEVGAPKSQSFTDGSFSISKWMFGRDSDQTNNDNKKFISGTTYNQNSTDWIQSLSSLPYKKFDTGDQAFWIQGVGAISKGERDGLSDAYHLYDTGVVSGYEFVTTPDSLLGVLASVIKSNMKMDDNIQNMDAYTYSLGLYGQKLIGDLKLTGIVMESYSKYQTDRYVDIGGISGSPEADYDGWGTSATLGISQLYEHDSLTLEPFLLSNFSTMRVGGYQETGGGIYDMSVSGDTTSSASLKTGISFAKSDEIYNKRFDFKVKPYVGYTWDINASENSIKVLGATDSISVSGRNNKGAQVGMETEFSIQLDASNLIKFGANIQHEQKVDSGLVYVGYGLNF